MNTREKIARALAKGAYENMAANDLALNMDEDEFVGSMWPNWSPRVDMILDAMREPGPEIEAVSTMSISYLNGDIWTRFIDAIKEGK